jgi:hypothetical protein
MQEITNFTHPVELSDKELDLVAAGWSNGGGSNCGCRESGGSLINVSNNQTNVGVNILGEQNQGNFRF